MGQLHTKLIEQYTQHYARVNTGIEPSSLSINESRRLDLMLGQLIRRVPEGGRILDVGCGTGRLLYWLSGHRNIIAIGVDLSPGQVELARRGLPGVEIYCEDGLDYMRHHPGEFYGIFCFDVLEHMPTKDACLEWASAALQALHPGGFFVCRVPNAANLAGGYCLYMDLTHEILFTRTSLTQLLEAAGFSDIRMIKVQAAHLAGKVRLWLEWSLHRAVFLVCGRRLENVFTSRVHAVGYRG